MPASLNLVIVEDNLLVAEEMSRLLQRHGYRVHSADSGEQLNEILCRFPIDIVLLDINLPYEDGYSIAKRLRQSHPYLAIVMITARSRHSDRALGYESGADVFIAKPVQSAELLAVLSKLAARLMPAPIARYTLSRRAQTLSSDAGPSLDLTPNEYLILELLMLSPEQEADIEYLRLRVNRDGVGKMTRETLYVLISRLRAKVSATFGISSCISAIRGYGYKLNLPLSAA